MRSWKGWFKYQDIACALSIQRARLSFQLSELAHPPPHPKASGVPPPPLFWTCPPPPPMQMVWNTYTFLPGGGHTRMRVRGRGEPIRTKILTLWYSRYGIIPLSPCVFNLVDFRKNVHLPTGFRLTKSVTSQTKTCNIACFGSKHEQN